jgi:hypothetical protein
MSKQELADRAGVSVRTLMNWCEPFQEDLQILGMKKHAKVLNPGIVAFMAEKFCIDIGP